MCGFRNLISYIYIYIYIYIHIYIYIYIYTQYNRFQNPYAKRIYFGILFLNSLF